MINSLIHTSRIKRLNPFMTPMALFQRSFLNWEPIDILNCKREVFGIGERFDLFHMVSRWFLAGRRSGTSSSKQLSEVSGSTRKILPQKGTGRARAGASRRLNRRGGACAFGPKPKDWSFPLNYKILQKALHSSLSLKVKEGSLIIVSDHDFESFTSTKFAGYDKRLANLFDSLSQYSIQNRGPQIRLKRILLIDTNELSPSLSRLIELKDPEYTISPLAGKINFVKIDKLNAFHVLHNTTLIITERAKQWLEREIR